MKKELCADALRLMLNSRYFEEKTEQLFAAGLIHGTTHLANGQEACQAGLSIALEDGDWIVPTHRCHGFTLCHGSSPYAMFSEMFGSSNGLAKGLGGSMHMPDREHFNLGSSAVVGSGVPLACGCAFTLKRNKSKNLSVAIFGDGATSRGSIHESMNLASIWKLPVLFFCENNLYGMSASSDKMISIKDISKRAASYSIPGVAIDGNDFEAVFNAVTEAAAYIREGNGPYFIVANTYRQKGHSKSDKKLYRTVEEEKTWLLKDPVLLFEKKLVEDSLFTREEIDEIEAECRKGIEIQAEKAFTDRNSVLSKEDILNLVYDKTHSDVSLISSPSITFREAIRRAMSEEMTSDSSVYLMGEDIGIYGGCFKVSEGLISKHPDQVIDTPVSEESFTGLAVGSAMTGMRPIVEIMYADFFTLIFDPVVNHAAKTHFMSGGQFNCPIVVRLPEGSGTGHGAQHTQSPEALFMNTTGLKIVAPSNPSDAYKLMKASIRDNNPVLFFEHKLLYGTSGAVDDSPLDIGQAKVVREGKDVTVISYSHAVITALETAEILHANRIEATVVDLCSLKPIDENTVLSQVRKTGRAVIIQDPCGFGGVSSQICSLLVSDKETFNSLKCPVLQLTGENTPVPFSAGLEKSVIPQSEDCAQKIKELF